MADNTDLLGKVIATQGVAPSELSPCQQAKKGTLDGKKALAKAIKNRKTKASRRKLAKKPLAIAGAFVETKDLNFTNKIIKMISCHSESTSFNGQFEAGQKKGTITLCDNHSYTFGKQRHTQFGCHAETKLISALAKVSLLKGAKVTFNIFWRNLDGVKNIPCPSCFEAMCEAANKCNVEIAVCSDKNVPVEMDKTGECNDKTNGYTNFTDRVSKGKNIARVKSSSNF